MHVICAVTPSLWIRNQCLLYEEKTLHLEKMQRQPLHLELEDRASCSCVPSEMPLPSPSHLGTLATEVLRLFSQLLPVAVRWPSLAVGKDFFPQSILKISWSSKALHFLFYHHWKGEKMIVYFAVSVVYRHFPVQLLLLQPQFKFLTKFGQSRFFTPVSF